MEERLEREKQGLPAEELSPFHAIKETEREREPANGHIKGRGQSVGGYT